MKVRFWKKTLSVCLALLMVAALVPAQLIASVGATSGVSYLSRSWNGSQVVTETKTADWKSPLEAGCRAGIQDVSIVADHMMLAAWDIGIGSCWVNYFKPSEVKAAFGLPENETPILLMTLGYPADDAEPLKLHYESKDMTEIVKIL